MPPFSTDDYHKLLQKITVLENKIHRLELNVEVNGLCGNNTTLPWTQSSGHEHANANTWLISTTKALKKQEGQEPDNISASGSPPWNTLGAKPKSKSLPGKMGGRVTGRTQRPEICDATGWPALSKQSASSSTPVHSGTQPWTAAKGRTNNKAPQQPSMRLENRFSPLLRLQGKLMTGPETLILGDHAVKDLRSMCSKNTKILCFPNDMVSDMTERVLHIVAGHPNVKNVIVHIGTNDVVKQQSEVLKRDFGDLLNTVSSLSAKVLISGPLPPVRKGVERFSRLLALNTWLATACTVHSLHFIDNFNFFWDRRHLFKADGLFLNKSGVKLFISNLFYFLPGQITV
uniref:SGNH hydrolase-type esterase domain-containing protein n=1 Tax=Myripristis murdjan TaxID=586833 RepID=A0A667WYM3_9TELE